MSETKALASAPIAVVTGASAGIGAEIARCAAADGYSVLLVARREERLTALADELRDKHEVEAWAFAADLIAPEGAAAVAEEIERLGRPVGVLVNNAGVGTNGPLLKSTLDKELGQIKLNVLALVELTQRLLPAMVARGEGRVLNIGSIAGFQPGPFMATYCATKAFVNHWSEAMAVELEGSGVTVTVHCPGPTESEFGAIAGNDKSLAFKRLPLVPAAAVAEHAWRTTTAGKVMAVHGVRNWLTVLGVRFAPRGLVRRVAARMNSHV